MKVFITKHALTAGIKEVEVEPFQDTGMVIWKEGGWSQSAHGEGRNWHRTIESAINKACDMRIRKIASLEKQIEKLRKLEFKQ